MNRRTKAGNGKGAAATRDARRGKKAAALKALRAYVDRMLHDRGGYPAAINGVTIRGWVVVAPDCGSGRPTLEFYRWSDLLRWHKNALAYIEAERAKCEEVELWEAMSETESESLTES